jgi:hypothetical protein
MNMPEKSIASADHVSLSIALSLFFCGLSYALPFRLFPEAHPWNGVQSSEILNLYCIVAWMGLAHFVFAYNGQFRALIKIPHDFAIYLAFLIAGAAVLFFLRAWLGANLFSTLSWIYFLPHFLKAETHFSSTLNNSNIRDKWKLYGFPTLAFAWFSAALYGLQTLPNARWFLVGGSLALASLAWIGGIVSQMKDKNLSPYALLGFLFIGEALLWGTYSGYMTLQFRNGVYIIHIALASFYHYFHSYVFADLKMRQKRQGETGKNFLVLVFVVNLFIVLAGYIALLHPSSVITSAVLDVNIFTFWVALHLWASDCFNAIRKYRTK